MEMEEHINRIKAAVSVLLAALTALWGWFGWLVVGWIALLVLDWITGTAVAMKGGQWSSQIAREGAWHKLGSIVAVLVAGVLDLVLGLLLESVPLELPIDYATVLCPMVIIWYILTEAGSIVENAGALGAPLPAWLRRIVASLRDKVDDEMDESNKEV